MQTTRLALFRSGFRPFFLAGAIFGMVALLFFMMRLAGIWSAEMDFVWWHRHEMLFGFAGAVVAGFFFTAVPNWTGHPTPQGWWLGGIFSLWLFGRILVWMATSLPLWLVAVSDVVFFLVCALGILPALVKARNRRNYFAPLLLGLLAMANALTYSEYAEIGLRLALAVIVLLLVIIGGRVIPFFTERALGVVTQRNLQVERWTLATTITALSFEIIMGQTVLTALFFLAAAVTNAWRLTQWHSRKTMQAPLLWVLHLGYLWLVLGFALKAANILGLGIPVSAATHALTIGAIGGLILGMIARVSLGHTGRPLQVGKAMACAFAAIHLAALLRVLGVWAFPGYKLEILGLAVTLWLFAFGTFVVIYVPILLYPRVDGRDG